jgi:hypothetical protein
MIHDLSDIERAFLGGKDMPYSIIREKGTDLIHDRFNPSNLAAVGHGIEPLEILLGQRMTDFFQDALPDTPIR